MAFLRRGILRGCWIIDYFKILFFLKQFSNPVHFSACWASTVKFNLKYQNTVEPRFNEVPRDWGNWFVVSRARYIEVLFHTLHYNWAEKYRSLYRGLRYIEVR